LIAVDVKFLKTTEMFFFSNLPPSSLDCFENIVPDFFPSRCLIFLELALLVALPDLSHQGVEHVVHMAPVRCAGFVKGAVELVSQREPFLPLNHSLRLLQIHLVSNEDDWDFLGCSNFCNQVSVLYCLVETVPVRDAVADDESLPTAHVLLAHCREFNLPGSVEDIKEARLRVDDGALLVGVLDRRVMVVDEVVLDVL